MANNQPLRIAVSPNLVEYLEYLARTTTRGKTANDVALSILTEQLEVMRAKPEFSYRFKDQDKGS